MGLADRIILKGSRIVIPKHLEQDVLEQLHYAHQGMKKCKLRAKSAMFWSAINTDIEEMVAKCSPCQNHQEANQKEPLMPLDVPPQQWHILAVDLFYWGKVTTC